MEIPTQYQVITPSSQTTIGRIHSHTPSSVFQHIMGERHQSHSWRHVPEAPPMYMPWSVPSVEQLQLVRFTGERQQSPCGPMIHKKRKLDLTDNVGTRPTKRFISEEKMAAHFSAMHISSNCSSTEISSTSLACSLGPLSNSPADVDPALIKSEDGKSMHPRLVISEELKRLQSEPLLPASLLSKLERPSMALVLWEPPSRHLRLMSVQKLRAQPSTSTIEEDDNNNDIDNNNEQILDLNQRYASKSFELEPMDL